MLLWHITATLLTKMLELTYTIVVQYVNESICLGTKTPPLPNPPQKKYSRLLKQQKCLVQTLKCYNSNRYRLLSCFTCLNHTFNFATFNLCQLPPQKIRREQKKSRSDDRNCSSIFFRGQWKLPKDTLIILPFDNHCICWMNSSITWRIQGTQPGSPS